MLGPYKATQTTSILPAPYWALRLEGEILMFIPYYTILYYTMPYVFDHIILYHTIIDHTGLLRPLT